MAVINIKMMKKVALVFLIVMALFLAVFFTIHDHLLTNRLYSEFKEVSTKDEFNGIITNLYTERGACFVTIGSEKMFLHSSGNSLYSRRALQDNLSIGDSIVKKSGSDSVFIYRDKSEYYFVLGEFINEHPR